MAISRRRFLRTAAVVPVGVVTGVAGQPSAAEAHEAAVSPAYVAQELDDLQALRKIMWTAFETGDPTALTILEQTQQREIQLLALADARRTEAERAEALAYGRSDNDDVDRYLLRRDLFGTLNVPALHADFHWVVLLNDGTACRTCGDVCLWITAASEGHHPGVWHRPLVLWQPKGQHQWGGWKLIPLEFADLEGQHVAIPELQRGDKKIPLQGKNISDWWDSATGAVRPPGA